MTHTKCHWWHDPVSGFTHPYFVERYRDARRLHELRKQVRRLELRQRIAFALGLLILAAIFGAVWVLL